MGGNHTAAGIEHAGAAAKQQNRRSLLAIGNNTTLIRCWSWGCASGWQCSGIAECTAGGAWHGLREEEKKGEENQ